MAETFRSPVSPATTRRVARLGSLPRLNVIDPEVPVQPVESLQKLLPPETDDCHAWLEFADNGTTGRMNSFGELGQLGRLVTTNHEKGPTRFCIADTRNAAPDYRDESAKAKAGIVESTAYQMNENEDADDVDGEEGDSDYTTHYESRYGKFLNVSNGVKRGFGLRLAEPDKMQNVEAFYRNDKHPEVHYTIAGKADVVVRVGIKDGQVAHQISLKALKDAQSVVQVDLLLDLSIALADVPYSKFLYEEGIPFERTAEKCTKLVTKAGQAQWILFNYDYQISAALFCNDGRSLDFNINSITKEQPSTETPDPYQPLLHCEKVYLRPDQVITYTAVFRQSAIGGNLQELGRPIDFFDIEALVKPPVDGMWWRFKTLESSFIHRRALESVLTHFLPTPRIPSRTLGELEIQPGTFYDHEMVDTAPNTMLTLEQLEHLLAIDSFLDIPDVASASTIDYYKNKIRSVILGVLVYLSQKDPATFQGKWNMYADRWDPADNEFEVLLYQAALAKERWMNKESHNEHLETVAKFLEDAGLLDGEAVDAREITPFMDISFIASQVTRTGTERSDDRSGDVSEEDGSEEGHDDAEGSFEGDAGIARDDDQGSISDGSEDTEGEERKDSDTDKAGKTRRIDDANYGQRLLGSKFIIVVSQIARRYKEAATLVKVDLQEHINSAWALIRDTSRRDENSRSALWYDYIQEEDTNYYKKVNVPVYSLGHQVTMWKTTVAMARLWELFPKLKTKADTAIYLDPDALRANIFAKFVEKVDGKSRFFLRREGHKRHFIFSQEDVILLSPPQNDYFFVNAGAYDPAWLETLRIGKENECGFEINEDVDDLSDIVDLKECKLELARYFAGRHGECLGDWAVVDPLKYNATDHFGVKEKYTAMSNLFTIDEQCTLFWFLAPTWLLLTDYPALTAERLEKGAKRALKTTTTANQGTGDGPSSRRGRSVRPGSKAKKHNRVDLTERDRQQVYNPPTYGSHFWYEPPRFFEYQPDTTLEGLAAITAKLKTSKDEKWISRMHFVWASTKAKELFFQNLDLERLFEEDESFRRTLKKDLWTIDWRGSDKQVIIKSGKNIFRQLAVNRQRETLKRRLINIYDCRTELLLATMLFMDPLERDHLIKFLNHIRTPDTHKMDFSQRTLMPENLWVTEYNISFVAFLPPSPRGAVDHELKALAYAPKRRSEFCSLDPTVPASQLPTLTDAVYAFRFVGDLHDRMWTCWKIRDLGYVEDKDDKSFFLQNRSSDTTERIQDKIVKHKQRKVLEGSFVKESLRIIIKETNRILDELDAQMDKSENATTDPLLPAMLKNEDLDGENYYVTMNKHGVYYPWIIQLCSTLKDKCVHANNAATKWMDASTTWDFRPRWTERDQADNKEALKKNNMDVVRLQGELDQTVRRIRSKSASVAALKESLAAELSLREARTATQQADSINQFTVVTVIFVPLGFATSVVSIQEFAFSDPVAALLWIMIPITIGTIVFLINLPIIYLHFCLLMKSLQTWLRRKMTNGEIHWEFWENRSKMLYEAEKKNTVIVNNTIHRTETNWWYWHYFTVFLLVVLPVRELRFANEVIHGRRIKRAGVLKKIARMIWAPLWIVLLLIDYIVIFILCLFWTILKGISKVAKLLWNGFDEEDQVPLLGATPSQGQLAIGDGSSIIGGDPAKMAMAAVMSKFKPPPEESTPLWRVPIRIMKLAYITKLQKNGEVGAPGA